ncbi:MAG: serine/threonine-protein kinase, partial [Polyangiales bacterium]
SRVQTLRHPRPAMSSGVHLRPLRAGAFVADRYLVEGPLAEGGMGEVFGALDVVLDRRVALKVVRPGGSEEERRRFLREAALTASVRHPNVVQVLDLVFVEAAAVLVLERLEGQTLRARLEHEGALPLDTAWRFLDQLLGALVACHESGVVHRDVKPDNLMVVPARGLEPERLVLLDFGLGKPLRGHTPLTEEGAIVGTPGYLAPEQLLGRAIDARTDVHGFGVTAYEVLTGQRLYEADGMHATMLAVLTALPPSAHGIRPALPAAVDGLLSHALAKEPEDRWADVAALRRAWRTSWPAAS